MITMKEIIETGLTIMSPEDGIALLEGDVDRRECAACTERMGLPADSEEWDVCQACPVMRKMKPELKALLEEAGI